MLERCNAGDRGVYPEKGCMIGDIISIEELGRGDIDHDGMENMAVLIEFHAIGSTYSTCYGAIMSGLSENGLFAVKRFSKSGRCG